MLLRGNGDVQHRLSPVAALRSEEPMHASLPQTQKLEAALLWHCAALKAFGIRTTRIVKRCDYDRGVATSAAPCTLLY